MELKITGVLLLSGVLSCIMLMPIIADKVRMCNGESRHFKGGIDIELDFRLLDKLPAFLESASVLERYSYTRSLLECVTICWGDSRCNSAIYGRKICTTMSDTLVQLTVQDGNDDIIDINRPVDEVPVCAGGCTSPTATCVFDCTNGTEAKVAICAELDTSAYNDGCSHHPIIQAKEYFLQTSQEIKATTSTQKLFTVQFVKLDNSSDLKIRFRSVMSGVFNATNAAGIYRILIDGEDCQTPGRIEGYFYNAVAANLHQKSTGMHGICSGIHAGIHNISLSVDLLTSGAILILAHSNLHARVFVDEIQTTITNIPAACPTLPVYNTQTYIIDSSWTDASVPFLWNGSYVKMESDTVLRINVNLVQGQIGDPLIHTCFSHRILIDGQPCSPLAIEKSVAFLSFTDLLQEEHHSTEFEGHCSGLSAGTHTISLSIGYCPGTLYPSVGQPRTGHPGIHQRLVVEEIHLQSTSTAVRGQDGHLYRIPEFNIQTFPWTGNYPGGAGEDTGFISQVTASYTKLYEDSGLRLVMSIDGRSVLLFDGNCCRHYLTINGKQCSSPGTIEAVHYLNVGLANAHRQAYVDGVCYGVPAGTLTIELHVGQCAGHTGLSDCHLGYYSTNAFLISETFHEQAVVNMN